MQKLCAVKLCKSWAHSKALGSCVARVCHARRCNVLAFVCNTRPPCILGTGEARESTQLLVRFGGHCRHLPNADAGQLRVLVRDHVRHDAYTQLRAEGQRPGTTAARATAMARVYPQHVVEDMAQAGGTDAAWKHVCARAAC